MEFIILKHINKNYGKKLKEKLEKKGHIEKHDQ
jgi:hypothetical protein